MPCNHKHGRLAELFAEEEAAGEFDAASEANTSEQSIALETISIDDIDMPEIDIGAELDQEAGMSEVERDPGVDPNAWAYAEPSSLGAFGFEGGNTTTLGTSSKLQAQESSSVLDALSSALSMPHARRPSHDTGMSIHLAPSATVPTQLQAPRTSGGVPSTTAPAQAAPDSDSDDEVTEAEAQAAMQSMGGGDAVAGGARAGLTMSAADSTLLKSLSRPLPARAGATTTMGGGASGDGGQEAAPLAVIVYGFEAEEDGEMTVREGDEVYVLEYLVGGWVHVQMVLTAETGNVPDWAVEIVAEGDALATDAWAAPVDGAPEPYAPIVPDTHITGDMPKADTSKIAAGDVLDAMAASKAPFVPSFAGEMKQKKVARGEVREDNPFGLIDISSPAAEDTEGAVADEAAAEEDWLGGLGEIYTPQPVQPPSSKAGPVSASAADPADAPLPQHPSLLSPAPHKAVASHSKGDMHAAPMAAMPAVDNPFGTSAFGENKGGIGEGAPTGDNPFEGGVSSSLPPASVAEPAAPAVQFPGGLSDNPFGGM
jgi:hypothetical protein